MHRVQSASARALRFTRRSSSRKVSNSIERASNIGTSVRLSAGSLSIVSSGARVMAISSRTRLIWVRVSRSIRIALWRAGKNAGVPPTLTF